MKTPPIRKALIIFKEELPPRSPFNEHEKTLLEVERVLKKFKIDHKIVSRGNLKKVEGFDLLLTVGGDGTFLDTSHYASSKHLLLGVNSHPALSHGAFCIAKRKNFETIFSKLLKAKAPLLHFNRLRVRIGKRKIPILALNEVLFSNRSPAGTSRYLLKIGKRAEGQKSSGLWISTAAGSTAALRSAGGRPMPKGSTKIQFIVREPFVHPGRPYRILKGTLAPSQCVRLTSRMSKAAVFLDGAHLSFDVGFGEEVEIRGAKDPVRAVLKP